jgi:hypothetical protein
MSDSPSDVIARAREAALEAMKTELSYRTWEVEDVHRAAIDAYEAEIGKDLVLVPRIASDEMLEAFRSAILGPLDDEVRFFDKNMRVAYAAMIEAAQGEG